MIEKSEEKEIVREEIIGTLKLIDFTTTVTEIRCDECNKIDKSYMDEWEAAEAFLDRGWDVIGKKCLCESCIMKK